jgi:hypothetical protein
MKKLIAGAALGLMVVGAPVASVFAGEIGGGGKYTPVESYRMHSICAFSGLEDGGDFPGQPAGPGATPQNWGQTQQVERANGATVQDLKASGFQPGDSCNGRTGFLVGGEPTP